jgi:DnaD/phage-associated family protein
MTFSGFESKVSKNTPLPGQFFSELLPQIDHLGELKLTLYVIWRLDRLEGTFRYVRKTDIAEDTVFMLGLAASKREQENSLDEALERAVGRGTLLRAELALEEGAEYLYFLNSPKGRAAVQGLSQGKWHPKDLPAAPIELSQERPNIYRLYEAHVGPLTPMLAESLRDAEDLYPTEWIEDAIRIAIENNVRKWRYIEAILKSWQEQGRHDQEDRRDSKENYRKYTQGEFADYIES